MTRTFLVAITVDDGSMLEGLAEDIQDKLIDAGLDVESVKQWATPAQAPPMLGMSLPPKTI